MSNINVLQATLNTLENQIDKTDIESLKMIMKTDDFDRKNYHAIRQNIRNLKLKDIVNEQIDVLWNIELQISLYYSCIKLPKDKNNEIVYTYDLLNLYNEEENKGYLQSFIEKVQMLNNKSYEEVIKWIKDEKKKMKKNKNTENKKKQ